MGIVCVFLSQEGVGLFKVFYCKNRSDKTLSHFTNLLSCRDKALLSGQVASRVILRASLSHLLALRSVHTKLKQLGCWLLVHCHHLKPSVGSHLGCALTSSDNLIVPCFPQKNIYL